MIAIIDYGAGNLFSLASSLRHIGAEAAVTDDIDEIKKADRMILPGVGAFGDAAAALRERGLDSVIREEALAGKPLLGICLGMQLLFERSLEYGEHQGLGLIRGTVRPLEGYIPEGLKIPQIGWNSLQFCGVSDNGQDSACPRPAEGQAGEQQGEQLEEKIEELSDKQQGEQQVKSADEPAGKHCIFKDVPEGSYVYFVHSYYGDADPSELIAACDYGKTVTAAVAKGSVVGCQFHPEKSGDVGMQILRNFCSM